MLAAHAVNVICGCDHHEAPPKAEKTVIAPSAKSPDDPEFEQIRLFCGNCHAFPQPASFPKSMWYDEVRRGFNFYHDSGRSDLKPPAQASVTEYFRQFAPEKLLMPEQTESSSSPVSFRTTDLSLPKFAVPGEVGISFVDLRPNAEHGMTDLWLSDMQSGMAVQLADVGQYANSEGTKVDGHVRLQFANVTSNPAATRQVDLDGNGIDDLLLADLGSYLPGDHDRGKVVWIPDGVSAAPRPAVTILDHIGRVAEVQVGDFDGDGRSDVVVGEFGWHKTGSLRILLNHIGTNGEMTFDAIQLDHRPGTIHVIPTDVNQDGRLDLMALISQEHEKIIAFVNMPDGFQKVSVYDAPDPAWGSSGIFLTDFDQDGDADVLYTNGDSFDSHMIKPYHGVWWLENQGSMPFTAHHLAAMPGVHRAIPADVDSDGDLDVVVAAMLPVDALRGQDVDRLHAIVWLERSSTGDFVRHVIEHGRPNYAAIAVGDLNQDDRPDIVAGIFLGDDPQSAAVAKIYWNQKSHP